MPIRLLVHSSITHLILLLSFCSYGDFINAQENFISGYVIDQNGQRFEGQLDVQPWLDSPTFIRFKIDDKIDTLTPQSISTFGASSLKYISADVNVEVSPRLPSELDRNEELHLVRGTHFLRVLVDGEKSLFRNVKASSIVNFYISINDSIYLLTYKQHLVAGGTKFDPKTAHRSMHINDRFKGQLKYYLSPCKESGNWIERSHYNSKSLVKLFHKYYECIGTPIDEPIQSLRGSGNKRDVILLMSGAVSYVVFNDQRSLGDFFMENSRLNIRPNFGMRFHVGDPQAKGQGQFFCDFVLASYGTSREYERPVSYSTRIEGTKAIFYSALRGVLFFRYDLSKGKHPVFLDVGPSVSYLYRKGYNDYRQNHIGTSTTEVTLPLFGKSPKFELGAVLGAGVDISEKWVIESRFEYGAGVTPTRELKSYSLRAYLTLSWLMNR